MSGFVKEFKEFATRGNVMDMAVGFILGAAFTAIVTSLVKDVLMPLIGIIFGGIDFSSLSITVGVGSSAAVLAYGSFIQAIINFLLIALVLFLMIRAINRLRNLRKPAETPAEPEARTCPFCREEISVEATRCPHCTSQLG